MPKREIVPEPIVTVIDDYDGKELHADTPPERYQLRGRTYDLYLSSESKQAVDTFLDDLLDGAGEVRDTVRPTQRGGARSGASIVPGFTIHDLREWAHANGHKVSDNRRAPTKVIEAFNAAHS